MTGQEFRVWQAKMGIKNGELASILGRSRDTISAWRSEGIAERDCKLVALALRTVERDRAGKK